MRGVAVLPGPLSAEPRLPGGSRRDRFDALVLEAVQALESRWGEELEAVEFGVEEAPVIPDDWSSATVPLASVITPSRHESTRVVVFRRPLEARADTSADLGALVLTVLVEQVAELIGRRPDEVDPRYDGG